MIYLLDTNICIHAMSRKMPALNARLDSLPPWEIAMSAITLAELEFGVAWVAPLEQRKRRLLLDLLCQAIQVLPFDAAAARAYAAVRLADPERSRNALDKLIAAHAMSVGATLVTANAADFARFEGLKVENWAS